MKSDRCVLIVILTELQQFSEPSLIPSQKINSLYLNKAPRGSSDLACSEYEAAKSTQNGTKLELNLHVKKY